MKYIAAEKLKAEIERYKQGAAIARFDNAGENADYFQGKVDLCNDLTHIIDSLQQDQPEVDLEKACDAYCKVCGHYPHTTPTYICRQDCDYFRDFEASLNARKEE